MSLGRKINFVGHEIFHVNNTSLDALPKISNVIYKAPHISLSWIEESSFKIGEWRGLYRSAYMRWALAINGLHVAADKYNDGGSFQNKSFHVRGLRIKDDNPTMVSLAEWDGKTAAKAHLETVNMIASYGIIDLYSCLEEMIFDFYKTYLINNPTDFLKGPDNRALRKLYRNKDNDPQAWQDAWKERIERWQRKRIYDGLDKVLLAYINSSGIEKPSYFKNTTPETWAETIKLIAILRNCLSHGEKRYSRELSDLSKKPHGLGFNFIEGEEINLSTSHLMGIELFGEQLLTALNLSLIELGEKKLKEI